VKKSDSLLSIITPSFNQGAYIEQTIQSVLHQDYQRVEHIVIDGGSTDSTVGILKRYPHLIWVSEKDRGQADALNKGLALAKGDIVGWINSDDYYRPNIFGSVAAHFRGSRARWVVGNIADVFDDGSPIAFRRSPTITYDALIRDPDIVRQQAAFFLGETLKSVGAWDADRYMVMDYDLWIRLAKVSPPIMIDEDWACFRNHAAQKTGHANILRHCAEITAVLHREKAPSQLIAAHRIKKAWYWTKGVAKQRLIDWGIVPQRYRSRPIRQH
jgi:glycosyltransferase involved in cell wall biosynthesis